MVIQSKAEKLHNADLVLNLDGKEEAAVLQSIVNAFADNTKTISLCLRSTAIAATWKTYCGLFHEIRAAGGVVYNRDGKLLMIFRNGKWDLPKGKMEEGEDAATAAIREVEEECGVNELEIIRPLEPVYHTYFQKGKWWLKETAWFEMRSTFSGEPIPQQEEGITAVKWLNRKEGIVALENTWSSLKALLKTEMENSSAWK